MNARDDVVEYELHDCPELFTLIEGKITIVLIEQGTIKEVALKKNTPFFVTGPHAGFCPKGRCTGKALVVERDAFHTVYRPAEEWLRMQKVQRRKRVSA